MRLRALLINDDVWFPVDLSACLMRSCRTKCTLVWLGQPACDAQVNPTRWNPGGGLPARFRICKQHRRIGKFFLLISRAVLPLSGTLLAFLSRLRSDLLRKPLGFHSGSLKNGTIVAAWYRRSGLIRSSTYTLPFLQASHNLPGGWRKSEPSFANASPPAIRKAAETSTTADRTA